MDIQSITLFLQAAPFIIGNNIKFNFNNPYDRSNPTRKGRIKKIHKNFYRNGDTCIIIEYDDNIGPCIQHGSIRDWIRMNLRK